MKKRHTAPYKRLLTLLFILPGLTQAANITVIHTPDADCSDDTCDFQSALSFAATNGVADTLTLDPTAGLPGGVLATTVPFEYISNQNFGLAINGSVDGSTLSGSGVSQVLRIENTASTPVDLILRNLTILKGSSLSGGGLHLSAGNAHVTIEGCSFVGNTALAIGGGALISGSGTATIKHSTFHSNNANEGAGLYLNFAALDLIANVFNNNDMNGNFCKGGGAYVASNWGGGGLHCKQLVSV